MIIRDIQNPYQYLFRTLIVGAFALNIPALIFMMSGNSLITMYLGLTQFMMFTIGVVFLIKGKQDVRSIIRLLNGELLAHWTYNQTHWSTFAHAEYKRQKENAIVTMVVFLIAGPLLAWIGYKDMTMSDGVAIGVVLGIFTFGIGMVYARNVLKRSEQPPYEAFISLASAYINGILLDWTSSGIVFLGASVAKDIESNDSSIMIRYKVRGRYGYQEKEMFVPIPSEKKDEAQTIAAKLNSYWKIQ